MKLEKAIAMAALAGFITGCDAVSGSPDHASSTDYIVEIAGSADPRIPVVLSKNAVERMGRTKAKLGSCGNRIALVGDSFTTRTYGEALRRLCGQDTRVIDNDGDPRTGFMTGEDDAYAAWSRRTGEMDERFNKVLADRPDTVVIFGGNNDILSLTPIYESITKNIESMITKAHKNDVRVVTVTVPPYRNAEYRARYGTKADVIVENILGVNDWMHSPANEADAIADAHAVLEDPNELNAVNPEDYNKGHPKMSGYRKIAKVVYEAILSIERNRDR